MKRRVLTIMMIAIMLFSSVGFAASDRAATDLIVRFEKGVELSRVTGVLRGLGVQARALEIINGVAFSGSPRAVAALEKHFKIVSVNEDALVYALPRPPGLPTPPGQDKPDDPEDPPEEPPEDPVSTQELDWGVAEIRANDTWTTYTGVGVKVAVLDTGIDLDHPDLDIHGGVNYDPRAKSYDDNNGHGTHVAGTIAALDNTFGVVGVAPDADLYAVKVLDRKGNGYTSNVILGIQWAVRNNMDVINMSLGSDYPNSDLAAALNAAESAGLITVAAAGNDTYDVDYPGAYPSTIAVGAINPDRTLASFSSRGPQVDVVAPGVEITSTYRGGGYRDLQGTSMATPHVAGLAALFVQKYPNADLDDFRSALYASSTDLGDPGWDTWYGQGLVDAVNLLQ